MPARILIIEDDRANLRLLSYMLRASGHTPLAAEDGEEGLAAASRERPDLILCDIQLPGIDGYEVARRLKGTPGVRAIPLVAVTASVMVGDRDLMLSAGFDDVLAKPFDPESFAAKVEAHLAGH